MTTVSDALSTARHAPTVPPYAAPGRAERQGRSRLVDRLPGIELVGGYRPAVRTAEVGGDWYDAFPLPDGTHALVIGDVVGHDRDAAVRMRQVSATIRALAHDRPEAPDRILQRLDGAVCGLDLAEMATVAYAVLEPTIDRSLWSLRWSSAGHLPPLVVGPSGTAKYLPQRGGVVIGVTPGADRPVNTKLLPAGCALVLYTDGLVEHRGRDIDDGMRAVEAIASAADGVPLRALCDALMGLGDDSEDDVAVLGARLRPPGGCPQAG